MDHDQLAQEIGEMISKGLSQPHEDIIAKEEQAYSNQALREWREDALASLYPQKEDKVEKGGGKWRHAKPRQRGRSFFEECDRIPAGQEAAGACKPEGQGAGGSGKETGGGSETESDSAKPTRSVESESPPSSKEDKKPEKTENAGLWSKGKLAGLMSKIKTVGAMLAKAPKEIKDKYDEVGIRTHEAIEQAHHTLEKFLSEESLELAKDLVTETIQEHAIGTVQKHYVDIPVVHMEGEHGFHMDNAKALLMANIGPWAVAKAIVTACRKFATGMCKKMGFIGKHPEGGHHKSYQAKAYQFTEDDVQRMVDITIKGLEDVHEAGGMKVDVDRKSVEKSIREKLANRPMNRLPK